MRAGVFLAVLALAAPAAFADADPMANAYANTFVVTEPSGAVLRYHFNADHTFDVAMPDGQAASGTYALANNQICLTFQGRPQPECAEAVTGKNVGETWTQTRSDGSQISVTLQAGR